mgnify:CR=1 FL=1
MNWIILFLFALFCISSARRTAEEWRSRRIYQVSCHLVLLLFYITIFVNYFLVFFIEYSKKYVNLKFIWFLNCLWYFWMKAWLIVNSSLTHLLLISEAHISDHDGSLCCTRLGKLGSVWSWKRWLRWLLPWKLPGPHTVPGLYCW